MSSIIRSLLYEEVVKAATTTEIDAETMIASLKPRHYSNGTPRPSKPPNDLSQANGDTGGFNGEQMSIEQLLEDLETGDVAWTDPQVQQWLSENGYELEPI
ncbi:MAG: hypothetical protein KME15_26440 [Drouetiella hepatica Uher 2000/2452]|uniref:Uncharacterized protein n=1 Tax=Drouetiella hepatica Uher 2000/2452 TaxID=904376 RepID=A0A951QFR1_9CYAN|nr:hypothetical protein [Drouetiella hepatica Uher 2000/2452]